MSLRAIAAMSKNRVIGKDGKIPWHLPGDFRWFKAMTTHHAVLMGRKTYESLGKPLPDRRNIVLTRGPAIPGVDTIQDLSAFDPEKYHTDVWVIGGAEIYKQLLPRVDDLYLTLIPQEYDGDTHFPEFEHQFDLVNVALTEPEFEVLHYRRRQEHHTQSPGE